MKTAKILFLSLITILLASCGGSKKIAFTTDVKQKFNLTPKTLQKLQFYTSDEIILYKADKTTESQIQNGKIVISESNAKERVIIKKGTPCVLVDTIANKFMISFEQGERALIFGNDGVSGGYYSLMAQSWKDKSGILTYGNTNYSTQSGNVYLTVKGKVLKNLDTRKRTVKGRKL